MLDEKLDYKILNKAIDKWGKEIQILIVIEECAELITAITKEDENFESVTMYAEKIKDIIKKERKLQVQDLNQKRIQIGILDEICEEAADVSIMLAQLFPMFKNHGSYNFTDNFLDYQLIKMKRLEEFIKKQ